MKSFEEVAALLVADDPGRQGSKALGLLLQNTQSAAGTVVSLVGDRPTLFVSRKLSLDALAALSASLTSHLPVLREGRLVESAGDVLAPVANGPNLVGVLFLEKPARALDLDQSAAARMAIGQALLADAWGGVLPSEPESEEEAKKQRLLAMLHRHEWNIARVARLLKVTRRTIYLRLERYGIRRERIPKRLERRRPEHASEPS